MSWIMFIGQVLLLFIFRQLSSPIIHGLADIIIIAISGYLWLWKGIGLSRWSLLFVSLLIDVFLARSLPFYTLTSMISIIVCQFVVLPYLSHTTSLSKLVTFALWLGIWRVSYFMLLGIGWFAGEAQLEVYKLWVSLTWWLIAAFGIVTFTLLLSRRMLRRKT